MVFLCHAETANKHPVFGGPLMNGGGSFGGLSGTGILPVLPKATSLNHVHQRSEESISITAPRPCFGSPAGFFASLRMIIGFKDPSPDFSAP
jgi:hypothetical protein